MLTRLRDRDDDRGVSLIELVVEHDPRDDHRRGGADRSSCRPRATASSTTERSISTAQARSLLQSWSTYLHVADDPNAADRR